MHAGLLSAVGSMALTVHQNSNYTLEWVPPFSLDIASIDPDIEGYCVDITSLSTTSVLRSQCGVNGTLFSYPIPSNDGCHDYEFTVTPVNVVGNGTTANVSHFQDQGEWCMH